MPYGDKESVTVSFNKMVKEFGFPETIKMEFLDNRYRYRPNGDIMIIIDHIFTINGIEYRL